MSKGSLIFIVFLTVSILLLFILGKDFFVSKNNKEEDQSKLNENKTITTQYLPAHSKDAEIEKEKWRENKAKYTSDEFQAGMNVLIYGHPDINEARKVFEHLRSLGFNSISINFPFYQKDWQANEVTTNSINTPTINELQEIIDEAHNADLSVMLRPIMDEQSLLASNKWRGQIKPTDPQLWFDSYQTLLLSYAKLAQSTNIKALNIGTELSSMQNQYEDRWLKLIENVRNVYKGELLYSFNWDSVDDIFTNGFVDSLDYIGIDAYFPLNVPDNASIEMLEKEWERKISQFKDDFSQKNIVVTEAGVIPIKGVYRTPYVWSLSNGKYDTQTQVNYYEATYNVWKPITKGIYWWTVMLGQDPEEISFSPLYSPTEKVIKKHYLEDTTSQ